MKKFILGLAFLLSLSVCTQAAIIKNDTLDIPVKLFLEYDIVNQYTTQKEVFAKQHNDVALPLPKILNDKSILLKEGTSFIFRGNQSAPCTVKDLKLSEVKTFRFTPDSKCEVIKH